MFTANTDGETASGESSQDFNKKIIEEVSESVKIKLM